MDSSFQSILVHPHVNADFSISDAQGCTPLEATFTNHSVGGSQFRWDFGDGQDTVVLDTDPLTHIYVNSSFTNEQAFEVSLTAENFQGCVSEVRKIITVFPDISSDFVVNQTEGCDHLQVEFTNISLGASSYLWDFMDGTTSLDENPAHTYTNTGSEDLTYTAIMVATNQSNCRDSSSLDILVHPFIQASFDSDSVACNLEEFFITDQSTGVDYYAWDFGDGTPASSNQGPDLTHIYRNLTQLPQVRSIQLTVSNEEGCSDQLSKEVWVYPSSKGGILKGEGDPIPFGSSTGIISLNEHQGKVVKWQKIIKAGPWEDISITETQYSENPASEGLWQYRVEVQSGNCPLAVSEVYSLMVNPKSVLITPLAGQGKSVGESDPVFSFTNSEWKDNTLISGFLGREPGEAIGEYAYTIGSLSAGPNYALSMDSASTKFTISAAVGLESDEYANAFYLNGTQNPFQSFTILNYALPEEGRVSLHIRDMSGRLMKSLKAGTWQNRGEYSLVVNADELESGLYIVSLILDNGQNIRMKTLKLIKSR